MQVSSSYQEFVKDSELNSFVLHKISGSSGSKGDLVFRFICPLFWQYICHNMQLNVCPWFSQIKVTFYDDWEGLLETVCSLLTSAAAAYWRDLSLRVTLASVPSFIKQSQKPAVWVRQDPMWLGNHCFPWEDISRIRKSSEWEGVNLYQWFGLGLWKRYVTRAKLLPSLTFTWHGKSLSFQLTRRKGSANACLLKGVISSGFLIVICISLDAKTQKL